MANPVGQGRVCFLSEPMFSRFSSNMVMLGVLVISTALFSLGMSGTVAAGEEDAVDFARDIQPIFARRCFMCHGPNDVEGGLALNSREGALAELDSGEVAIVPGDSNASVLVERIRGEGDGDRMPPEGKPLTDEEVELVERWIEQGADWEEHWSFRKPQRAEIPQPGNTAWVKTPIDAFVLSRLEQEGLEPAPPVDKVALLRRAYYDLTGLPPSLQEIDAFLADESPDAYEKVIDHLLDSKHYGEKWASHWLDLVRYAETNGYERDSRKELIWKYRDYVIRSLNNDKPYDRFVLEQLAGDELPSPDPDAIIATGYYRLGIWDDEPADRELARYDYLDDILRTTGESFIGMTIGCARCHDHKIDPVSQKDYYAMLDFFSNISPHGAGQTNHIAVSSRKDREDYEQRIESKRIRELQLESELREIEQRVVDALRQSQPDLKIGERDADDDRQVVLPDSRREPQTWSYTFRQPQGNWFDIAYDDKDWREGPGGFGTRGTPGTSIGTRWRTSDIWLRKDFRLDEIPGKVMLSIHHDENAEVYLNGTLVASFEGYLVDYQEVDLSTQAATLIQTGRNTLAIHCRNTGGGQYIDAGITISETDPVVKLVRQHGDELLGEMTVKSYDQLKKRLAESRAEMPQLAVDYAMAVSESGRNTTWILGRGLPSMKGKEVQAAFPQVLDPPEPDVDSSKTGDSSGKRLALAQWIASPENPMTSRVIVNRVWQHHFGRGIVRSSSDFGYQGTPPTHPELLDWLAVEFVDRGWSLKQLHKLIMMSNTYQMSSVGSEDALAKDPTNDLFWRFNPRRLTAEELRDSILTVSGTINLELFGPSVFPPVSDEVLATASRPESAWGNSPRDQQTRRTVYVHVKRSLRPPMLANFDAPETDTSCAVRVTTTVPTQALGMLNSEFMNEQALLFAQRVKREAPESLEQQIDLAIRLTTGRQPAADEIEQDLAFIEELQTKEGVSADEALRLYALLMLNTNEFVYLD